MSLKELNLKVEYRSDESNIVDNFYVPCLRRSTKYYRAVGYFTSQSLALAARGLSSFVDNQGIMRLVASPQFDKEDVEALIRGYEAREDIVQRALLRQIGHEVETYSSVEKNRFNCLAWLVAEGRLEIKIAFKGTEVDAFGPGIYHEKIGIFIDEEGDAVAFTGSPNETSGGVSK